MKFSDIVALAKAGYKPSEIKELMDLATEPAAGAEETAEIPPKEEPQPEQQKADEKPAPEPQEDKRHDDIIKQLQDQNRQLQEENRQLHTQLSDAQQNNTRRDNSSPKISTQEHLNDLVRSFM